MAGSCSEIVKGGKWTTTRALSHESSRNRSVNGEVTCELTVPSAGNAAYRSRRLRMMPRAMALVASPPCTMRATWSLRAAGLCATLPDHSAAVFTGSMTLLPREHYPDPVFQVVLDGGIYTLSTTSRTGAKVMPRYCRRTVLVAWPVAGNHFLITAVRAQARETEEIRGQRVSRS